MSQVAGLQAHNASNSFDLISQLGKLRHLVVLLEFFSKFGKAAASELELITDLSLGLRVWVPNTDLKRDSSIFCPLGSHLHCSHPLCSGSSWQRHPSLICEITEGGLGQLLRVGPYLVQSWFHLVCLDDALLLPPSQPSSQWPVAPTSPVCQKPGYDDTILTSSGLFLCTHQ